MNDPFDDPLNIFFNRSVVNQRVEELIRLCEPDFGTSNLLQACGVIARCEHPELDLKPTFAELDRMVARFREALQVARGETSVSPLVALETLRRVLVDQEGFRGTAQAFREPSLSFLHEVVRRRSGMPILMSAVAMYVADQGGVEAYGIGLPGHFVMRLGSGPEAVYADAFNNLEAMSEADCRATALKRLESAHQWRTDYLLPCTVHQMVVRMLSNLKHLSVRRKEFERALWVQGCLVGLLPDVPAELRDRGLLHARQHHYEEALRDLNEYKKRTNDKPPDAEEIERQLERVHLLRLMRN